MAKNTHTSYYVTDEKICNYFYIVYYTYVIIAIGILFIVCLNCSLNKIVFSVKKQKFFFKKFVKKASFLEKILSFF